MKKYLIRYTTKSGDYEKEWLYANSEEDAKTKLKDEHWNISSIDMVSEI